MCTRFAASTLHRIVLHNQGATSPYAQSIGFEQLAVVVNG